MSERERMALFESVPIGIAKVTTHGIPIACKKKFEELTGYSAEEAMRMPFATLVHPDDLTAGREPFLNLISGRIDHYETPKGLVHKQGTVFMTKMTVKLIRYAERNPDHTISMIEPISN